MEQLISYIAPAAPATRRPAQGNLQFVRPEIGFAPSWYQQHLDLDFGSRWHTDPAYRLKTIVAMRRLLQDRFPNTSIGNPELAPDLLTGTYGACVVAAIYEIPILYQRNQWPACEKIYLTESQIDCLEPPDLDKSTFFEDLLLQIEWIHSETGTVEGYINWQGVLNNAHRIRGEDLFLDMYQEPKRARRIFDCVCTTMIEAAKCLHRRQKDTGVEVSFFTISNCLVNLISPQHYEEFLLPLDIRIARAFDRIGIHNCAWKADPYFEAYAQIPNAAYIDMGIDSDLTKAYTLFPEARRAIMYKPTDLMHHSMKQIQEQLNWAASQLGPCDIVLADIEAGTPDDRVTAIWKYCLELSRHKHE